MGIARRREALGKMLRAADEQFPCAPAGTSPVIEK